MGTRDTFRSLYDQECDAVFALIRALQEQNAALNARVEVQRKASSAFRSRVGAKVFCAICPYLSTLRKLGLSILPALEHVLVGSPLAAQFQTE